MIWKQVLNKWENGLYPQLPKSIKKPFVWRTSCLDSQQHNTFEQEFVYKETLLRNNQQNLEPFKSHLNKNKEELYAISFLNLNGDTLLVIPKDRRGKNFSSLFYFMKEASERHQKFFWKRVAQEIKNKLKSNKKLFISTEGTGVPYLHIRISNYPKYYGNSRLSKHH